jgi:hypothetical protein
MAEPLTTADLRAIRRRCQRATPAPWVIYPDSPDGERLAVEGNEGFRGFRILTVWPDGARPAGPDAEFVAHARDDVPRLLAEVERLRALARAAPPHLAGRCASCAHWASYNDGRGECTASGKGQHEAVVGVVIRRADDTGFCFSELPAAERPKYGGTLVTPGDFGCTSWVPREGPEL